MKEDQRDQLQSAGATNIAEAADPIVRIRESRLDQYCGLKGHAYIAARGLGRLSPLVQTSALVTTVEAAR